MDQNACIKTLAGKIEEINVQLADDSVEDVPNIRAGAIQVNRRIFEELEPEMVIDMARIALQRKGDKKNLSYYRR